MKDFDEKQIKIILSWHHLSLQSEDVYMAFMAEWIAFNAICYNLYYEKAISERAQIGNNKKLKEIREKIHGNKTLVPEKVVIEGNSDKWKIELLLPEKLVISVSKNYTEDIIYNEFVKENKSWYDQHPAVQLFNNLKEALRKNDRYYVINMAKSAKYDENGNIADMSKRNIIVLCEQNQLKTIKNVLYQIRCNIFHGEKNPGIVNDDKIVKSALPLLRYIINYLITTHEIGKKNYEI
jgi:hypothetical protein